MKLLRMQLKALGFDLVNTLTQAQQNLNVIQQELQALANAPKEEKKK